MKIDKLEIKGFKSIGSIELIEPNPFTVFVGPNASGKSNIFEAIEIFQLFVGYGVFGALNLIGDFAEIFNENSWRKKKSQASDFFLLMRLGEITPQLAITADEEHIVRKSHLDDGYRNSLSELEVQHVNHYKNFTRVFVTAKEGNVKFPRQDGSRLSSNAGNLEKVLSRLLKNEAIRDEIFEWLQLLIPGLDRIEIHSDSLTGLDTLLVYETGLSKPIRKHLISDGTYNIIALLTAIYQSDEPQFLCIEEPENGINPKVIRELVRLIRQKCEEKGHYIWLNTHSQTLVAELTTDEIVLVDKVNGNTQVKQVKGVDLHGLRMDEALFTNTLGGGIPW